MGVNACNVSKTCVTPRQRSGRLSLMIGTINTGNNSNANTTFVDNVPRSRPLPLSRACGRFSEQEGRDAPQRKLRSGVYFQNREVSESLHPLQTLKHPDDSLFSKSMCRGGPLGNIPMGRPLSSAPVLGHLHNMRPLFLPQGTTTSTCPFHVALPVNVSKTVIPTTATVTKNPRMCRMKEYSSLTQEQALFWEATTSLRNSHVPCVIPLETPSLRMKNKNKKTTKGSLSKR